MKNAFIAIIAIACILTGFAACATGPAAAAASDSDIDKSASLVSKLPAGGTYKDGIRAQFVSIRTPANFDVQTGSATYSLGFGSGAEYLGNRQGKLVFVGITDRGPNLDGPAVPRGNSALSSKFFAAPSFAPQLVLFEFDPATLIGQAFERLPLREAGGKAISGLPLPSGLVGSTAEVALNLDLKDLGTDVMGLDPEAVRLDAQGNYWICDEYGPFIAQVDAKTGIILKKYGPGSGLPVVIAKRQPNRGMEGLAITPKGKIYGIVQSILDYDGNLKGNKAAFVRLVELDPKTGATRQFAVPIDAEAYKATKDAKLGDLVAISDTDFLMIEQGADAKKTMRNLVYRISIQDATDINNRQADGQELEKLGSIDALRVAGFKAATKSLVVDLRAYGWSVEKAEGLALIDASHLLVVSDNDFGVIGQVQNPAMGEDGKAATSATAYTLKAGGLSLGEQPTGAAVIAAPNNESASFLLLSLDKPLY